MGLYKHLNTLFKSENNKENQKKRLIEWRQEPFIVRIDKPTNLARARSLGYKAKQGVVLARIRISRGGRKRPSIRHGRRSAHFGQRLALGRNYQWVAEGRANKEFPNLEVLNSYQTGKDGKHYWFEVILIDTQHPSIKNDKHLGPLASGKHNKRVYRGLTSAARKSRGLRISRHQGREKVRPSLRAHKRKGK